MFLRNLSFIINICIILTIKDGPAGIIIAYTVLLRGPIKLWKCTGEPPPHITGFRPAVSPSEVHALPFWRTMLYLGGHLTHPPDSDLLHFRDWGRCLTKNLHEYRFMKSIWLNMNINYLRPNKHKILIIEYLLYNIQTTGIFLCYTGQWEFVLQYWQMISWHDPV